MKRNTPPDLIPAFQFLLLDEGIESVICKIIKEKDILTMHTKEATLEEIFIKVTGRELV